MCKACGSSTLNYPVSYSENRDTIGYIDIPVRGGDGANFWASQSATSDANTNGVISGNKWGGSTLTYSFPTLTTQYESGYGNELTNGFAAATEAMKTATRYALNLVSQYTNLVTTEVDPTTTTADIRTAISSEANPTAYAYYPSNSTKGGDVWYGTDYPQYQNPVKGQYAWATVIHELGHALGLKHGHETGGPSNTAMQTAFDQMAYSVMTYRSYVGAPLTGYTNETNSYAQTFMMYDISALQAMYGANFNTNSGNTTYTWNSTTGEMFINGVGQGAAGGNRIFLTIWDGNGTDTYDFSNYTTNLNVNLAPGAYSVLSSTQLARLHWDGSKIADGNVYNALQYNGDVRSLIENAIGGSGNDTLAGNAANNVLTGNAGTDTLSGLDGDDVLWGGLGADNVTGGNGNDLFYFRTTDLGSGVVDTVNGGGTTTDLIRIDGVQYFNLTVSNSGGNARVSVNFLTGQYAYIDVTGLGTSPVIVATSSSTIDPNTLTSSSRANLQLTWFDWANSQSYTQYTDLYTASGNRDRQFGTYDGTNGRWDFLWDPENTNSTWTYRFDYFNNANQQTQQQGGYDAGGSWIQTYDPTNAQAYSYYITYYDSLNRATQSQSFYDAGGRGITTWDVASTQAYSEYTTYYDAAGNADTQNGRYDGTNGTWWVDFDNNNNQAWQSYTVLYDQFGAITQRWLTMDNGSIVYL